MKIETIKEIDDLTQKVVNTIFFINSFDEEHFKKENVSNLYKVRDELYDSFERLDFETELWVSSNLIQDIRTAKAKLSPLTQSYDDVLMSFDEFSSKFDEMSNPLCKQYGIIAVYEYWEIIKELYLFLKRIPEEIQRVLDKHSDRIQTEMSDKPNKENSENKQEEVDKTIKKDIDYNAFEKYFKSKFKGIPNKDLNFLKDRLIPDLQESRSDIEYAKIALLIHESDMMISKSRPRTFARWYRIFCDIVGCKYHSEYKPNKLKDEELKRIFSYL